MIRTPLDKAVDTMFRSFVSFSAIYWLAASTVDRPVLSNISVICTVLYAISHLNGPHADRNKWISRTQAMIVVAGYLSASLIINLYTSAITFSLLVASYLLAMYWDEVLSLRATFGSESS